MIRKFINAIYRLLTRKMILGEVNELHQSWVDDYEPFDYSLITPPQKHPRLSGYYKMVVCKNLKKS